MIEVITLNMTNCGIDAWSSGEIIRAVTCPYAESMGGGFLILWGFAIFSSLAIYTRTATMPAVVAMLFVGLGSTQIPALGGWYVMRYSVVVAAVLLMLVILRMKR